MPAPPPTRKDLETKDLRVKGATLEQAVKAVTRPEPKRKRAS